MTTFAQALFFEIMCSCEDCEKLWFFYKLEGEPKGVSIEQFCIQQGVPYQVFNDRVNHRDENPSKHRMEEHLMLNWILCCI